jgi:hypothetical protein
MSSKDASFDERGKRIMDHYCEASRVTNSLKGCATNNSSRRPLSCHLSRVLRHVTTEIWCRKVQAEDAIGWSV